jgi:hypothetical protein
VLIREFKFGSTNQSYNAIQKVTLFKRVTIMSLLCVEKFRGQGVPTITIPLLLLLLLLLSH